MRALLDEHGLTSPSMHVDFPTMRTRLAEAAEAAHVLGQRHLIIPSLPKEERADLEAYRRLADEFNAFGRRAKELGVRFAYHNHGNETGEMEGEVPLRLLLERTDPELVDFEMDLYWMVAGGADPVDYFEQYPGRFRLVHIKDMAEPVRFEDPTNALENGEVFASMRQVTDPGSGVLDLDRYLEAAKAGGVQHFLIERDLSPAPLETLRKSYERLT